jgi:hypothetical protein
MTEINDRTKSNENLFSTQNTYADKINNIRHENRQYGLPYNPNVLELKNQMKILPNKPTTVKILKSELNYKVVGILFVIIAILGISSIFIILSIKQNIEKKDNKDNKIIATFIYNETNENYINTELFKEKDFYLNIICIENKSIDYENFTKVEIFIKPDLKSINHMFSGCDNLLSIDLSNISSSYIQNMSHTFENCTNLESINFTSFNSSNVVYMDSLFKGCKNLSIITGLESLNTSSLKNIEGMFVGCESLTDVNLLAFNLDNITNKSYVFDENPLLNNIYLKYSENITNYMCEIFNFNYFNKFRINNKLNLTIKDNGEDMKNSQCLKLKEKFGISKISIFNIPECETSKI